MNIKILSAILLFCILFTTSCVIVRHRSVDQMPANSANRTYNYGSECKSYTYNSKPLQIFQGFKANQKIDKAFDTQSLPIMARCEKKQFLSLIKYKKQVSRKLGANQAYASYARLESTYTPKYNRLITLADHHYKRYLANEKRREKEEAILAEKQRKEEELLALEYEAQRKREEYESLKNAGPESNKCIEARQKIADARELASTASTASSFIPGASTLSSNLDRLNSGLGYLETAVSVACIFDAVATGRAEDAFSESLGIFETAINKAVLSPKKKSQKKKMLEKLRASLGKK